MNGLQALFREKGIPFSFFALLLFLREAGSIFLFTRDKQKDDASPPWRSSSPLLSANSLRDKKRR